MNLNENSKRELRKKIIELTKKVSYDKRIQVDKDTLDSLLFITFVNENNLECKVPVWTGKFLRKIDLSEISFENVLFDFSALPKENLEEIFSVNYLDILYGNKFLIDLSYTNAKIDFSKIIGSSSYKCNFSHINLSNSNLDSLQVISQSDFSCTNIKRIPENAFLSGVNFKGNNLTNQEISANRFTINCHNGISDCNFNGTNLKIINFKPLKETSRIKVLVDEYLTYGCKNSFGVQKYVDSREIKQEIARCIINGRLDGCFLNGKRIATLGEEKTKIRELLKECEIMKEKNKSR